MALTVDAFLLVHVATHAFICVGPFVDYDLDRRALDSQQSFNATSGGLGTIVGVWF